MVKAKNKKMSNNWEIKTLGEVCQFRRGLTYSKNDEVAHSKNAVLRANNINLETNTLNFEDIRYISDEIIIPESKKLIKDSVMICTASGSRSHLGKVAFIDKDYDYAFGGFMGLLVPDSKIIDPKYFFTILTSGQFRDHINSLTAGANINNLKFSQIQDYPIVVPPLSEQKRIVKILDEKFESLEQLKKITEEQIKDAKELFESRLSNVFAELHKNSNQRQLGDFCTRVSVGHVGLTTDFYCESNIGIPFIRSQNVRPGSLDWKGIQYITKDFHKKLKKSQLQKGDLLFVRVGANRGDCCVLRDDLEDVNCANIVFARLKEGNSSFFELYCRSDMGRKQLLGMSVGAAQGVINTKSVAGLVVPYPCEDEQDKVVIEINQLSEKTKELELIFQRKVVDLEELKKSYLEQAFAGKL